MVCKSFNFRRGLPFAADCSPFENLMNPLSNKQILLLWSSMLGNYVALTLLVMLVCGASSETQHSGHDNLQYWITEEISEGSKLVGVSSDGWQKKLTTMSTWPESSWENNS